MRKKNEFLESNYELNLPSVTFYCVRSLNAIIQWSSFLSAVIAVRNFQTSEVEHQQLLPASDEIPILISIHIESKMSPETFFSKRFAIR